MSVLNLPFSETTEEGRIMFGCNRPFLLQHENDLKDIFFLKRYCCPMKKK
jgi:hypothetical protein